MSMLFSALAAADFTSFATSCAAGLGSNRRTVSAWPTGMPRTRPTIHFIFLWDIRTPLAVACTAISYYLICDVRSDLPACPRNVRVGANSPSLCPTMFSVMKSGTCLLPSCTAIVNPKKSGIIVDARDHVRTVVLEPLRLAASTFFANFSCTNGPFLVERDINSITSGFYGLGRSCCSYVCCVEFSCQVLAYPTVFLVLASRLASGLHHHHGGDPLVS